MYLAIHLEKKDQERKHTEIKRRVEKKKKFLILKWEEKWRGKWFLSNSTNSQISIIENNNYFSQGFDDRHILKEKACVYMNYTSSLEIS